MSVTERLGRAAVVVTVAAAGVVLATAAMLLIPGGGTLATHSGTPAPAYPQGTKLDVALPFPPGAERAVVLFARGTCVVCRTEARALAELVRLSRREPATAAMAILPRTEGATDAGFLAMLDVAPAFVVRADLGTLAVRVLPTVVVVGRSGLVERSWEGALTPQARDAIVEILAGSTSGRTGGKP